jgi:hypothetical protein
MRNVTAVSGAIWQVTTVGDVIYDSRLDKEK